MNETELELIRARTEKATPGPWQVERTEDVWSISAEAGDIVQTVYESDWQYEAGGVQRIGDAEFVAHARDDIPLLLAEVDRLQAKIADAWDEGFKARDEYYPEFAASVEPTNPYRSLAEGKTE